MKSGCKQHGHIEYGCPGCAEETKAELDGCIHGNDDRCPACRPRGSGEPPRSRLRRERQEYLERKRVTTKADLLIKFEDDDWHGVQDCGSDLRDIDSELAGLRL